MGGRNKGEKRRIVNIARGICVAGVHRKASFKEKA